MKSVLITGANAGLGKECARQLALRDETEKIYLGCRNEERAKAAKQSLEESTGKSIFEILLMDVSEPDSVRSAVKTLSEPVEGLVMNAGGMGGKNPGEITADGVSQLFATNVLGHVVLFNELVKAQKLTKVALYAGSEAARGVPKMGMARPKLKTSSANEFEAIIDGTAYGNKFDPMVVYGPVKYIAAMWMSSVARKNPDLRIVTISPGGTSGTNVMQDLTGVMKFMFQTIGLRIMPLIGLMHKVELGAKRFVDGLIDDSYKTGVFYASKAPVLTGQLIEQGAIFPDLYNEEFQDNAHRAIQRFIK